MSTLIYLDARGASICGLNNPLRWFPGSLNCGDVAGEDPAAEAAVGLPPPPPPGPPGPPGPPPPPARVAAASDLEMCYKVLKVILNLLK